MTRRGPQESATRPASGPTAPYTRSETAAAPESATRDQPNSASIGLMYTPNADRSPVPPSMANASAPRTIQAGCTRERITAGGCHTARDQLYSVQATKRTHARTEDSRDIL